MIFVHVTNVAEISFHMPKFSIPQRLLKTYQDSLQTLKDFEDVDPDSEGYITDLKIIYSMSRYTAIIFIMLF